MKDLFQNTDEYLALPKDHKRDFLDQLYQYLVDSNSNAVDYQKVKIQSTAAICPNCKSEDVIKAGKHNGRQVYKCKTCGYQFRETARTFVYRMRKYPLMLDYMRCMLDGKSLRACASEVGICLKTSFQWRHKILAALRSFEGGISFSGIVEADELLMSYSEKGRKFKSLEEYERARKKKHPKVAVLVVTDREGNLLFKQVGEKKVKNEQLKEELKNRISEKNLVCVKPKKEFKKGVKSLKSKKVVVNKRQVKRGIYSVKIVEEKIKDFKVWLCRFHGVATKYLQSYLMWFVITNKYLKDLIEPDIGRLLNLSSHDRWAWDKYRGLVKQRYK
jgi:transposase-like protein